MAARREREKLDSREGRSFRPTPSKTLRSTMRLDCTAWRFSSFVGRRTCFVRPSPGFRKAGRDLRECRERERAIEVCRCLSDRCCLDSSKTPNLQIRNPHPAGPGVEAKKPQKPRTQEVCLKAATQAKLFNSRELLFGKEAAQPRKKPVYIVT